MVTVVMDPVLTSMNVLMDQIAVKSTCINNDGDYTCDCPSGYESDRLNCFDINECITGENNSMPPVTTLMVDTTVDVTQAMLYTEKFAMTLTNVALHKAQSVPTMMVFLLAYVKMVSVVTVNTAWITTNVTIIFVVNESAPTLSAVSAVIVLLVSSSRALPVSMLMSVMTHLATRIPLLVPLMVHRLVSSELI